MSRLFISKDPEDLHHGLKQLHDKGVLEAKSLIAFDALNFDCPPAHDILFLASIRAADFFFARCNTNALIACAGIETAEKVAAKYNKEIAFIAQRSDQPQIETIHFNQWRAGRKVCFPSSPISIGSYAALLPENEKIILPVYNTTFKESQIEPKDIYIFSSPSNVLAFVKSNSIAKEARVVAWGSSTERELIQNGINVTYVLRAPQQADLLNWLNKVL